MLGLPIRLRHFTTLDHKSSVVRNGSVSWIYFPVYFETSHATHLKGMTTEAGRGVSTYPKDHALAGADVQEDTRKSTLGIPIRVEVTSNVMLAGSIRP